MDITSNLARFIIETQPESIPETILHEGKRCIINFIAVAIRASKDPSLQILLDIFREEGSQTRATILENGTQTSLQNAALANGYLGHFDDYDDTHFPTIIHPSSPTIPAALAVAEDHGISGHDFLTATVLGIETACRVALAIHPFHYEKGWHITGTVGVFGAVAAAGRLLGLNTSQMIHALGIAGIQAAGVREVFGSMSKPFHPGRSAQSGVLAVLLAKKGFTSTKKIFEGRRGFTSVLSTSYNLKKILCALGEQWELSNIGLKLYACGVVNHPLIDAVLAIRERVDAIPGTVDRLEARIHPLVLELVDRRHPLTGLEGKFSFYHAMAVALIDGTAYPDQFTDSRVRDPVVSVLRDCIMATPDSSLAEDQSVVTLTMRDGRSYTETIHHATGSPENLMTDEQVNEKFMVLANEILPMPQIKRLLNRLWDLDHISNVKDVITLSVLN
ncbi:MAG: MmgE/PrpD family protein [Candidatus Heimdallarchaeota archaeon]